MDEFTKRQIRRLKRLCAEEKPKEKMFKVIRKLSGGEARTIFFNLRLRDIDKIFTNKILPREKKVGYDQVVTCDYKVEEE